MWFGGGGGEDRTGDRLCLGETDITMGLVSKVGVTQSKGCQEVKVKQRIVVSLSRLGFGSYGKFARMSPRT